MSLEQQLAVGLQLLLAGLLSMIVGLDRERREKDAGLRTHMLVGVGACLFAAMSANVFAGIDPARIAASIVTGVGFLGAGVIYRSDHKVHDLTTAASIWLTAAIGMAVGLGVWLLAIIVTLLVWVILRVLWVFQQRYDRQHDRSRSRKT